MEYLMADAKCGCRTHLVAVQFPIGLCGACGEQPQIVAWSDYVVVEVD